MKFMHLGDLHLGRSLGDYDLKDDQEYMLDQLIGIMDEKKVDAVLIAGDVYDKALPSEAAVDLFDSFLTRISQKNIAACIISGNHDSDVRLNFGSRIFAGKNIYITTQYRGMLEKQMLNDEYGPVNIYMLPFVKASHVKRYYPDVEIQNYNDAVRTVIEHAEIDDNERNILIAHQFVVGGTMPETAGSEGAGVLNVGTVEQVSSKNFDSFDYVALGHIHAPQRVGREEVRYSGSILKYSAAEADRSKTVPIVTMGDKGCVDIELVPLKPERDIRVIKGHLNQILKAAQAEQEDKSRFDYIFAVLTDEEYVNDPMQIFRQYYPNTVKIKYENSHSREVEQVDIDNITGQKTFAELITEFYRQMYGTDIDDYEMSIILDAAEKEGIDVETD